MCSHFQLRLPNDDQYKSGAVINEQISKNKTCKLEDCNNPLTLFRGPGDKHLCREHQLAQREYGGLGRIDRLWTFSREWNCAWCGYNPKEDLWFENPPIPFDDEVHKNRVMRTMLVGDHGDERRIDGGSDGKDNVQTLCQNCNAKKTSLYKDYQRSKTEINC